MGMTTAARERVLLIPFSGLGDLMMHLPLVTVLKQDFDVDVVIERTYESFGSFLEAHGILSRYLPCNQSKTLAGFIAKVAFFLTEVDSRSYRYIMVYDRPLFSLLSLMLPSRKVIRYGLLRKTLRGPIGWSPHASTTNQTEAVMDFGRYLAYPAANQSYTFPEVVIDGCVRRARRLLGTFGIDGLGDRLLAICPFANHPYKQAPFTLFHKVARHALGLNIPVAMVGPSSDRWRAEAFRQQFGLQEPGKLLDLVGALDWEETVGLLALSAAVVSNDSGIMHVSLACGTTTVAFFGPTDPDGLIPRTTEHLHPIFLRLPCQPCWHKGPTGRFHCPDTKKACLEQIDADSVIRLVSGLVAGRLPDDLSLSPTEKR
jgi:ADP-heptose:LPS heptosyltransferase